MPNEIIEKKENNNIVTWEVMEKMAEAIAKSNMFGVKTREQALALMIIAQAENKHPGRCAIDYHIIDGKPSLKADTMLARFLEAGGRVEWLDYSDEKVRAKFSHPQGGSVVIEWDMKRAEKAGLTNRQNWKMYPRAMLRARVISEGIRTVYPNVLAGLYTPEEIIDMREDNTITVEYQKHEIQDQNDQTDDMPWEKDNGTTKEPTVLPKTQVATDYINDVKQIHELAKKRGIRTPQEILDTISSIVDREIKSSKDLTPEERKKVIEALQM